MLNFQIKPTRLTEMELTSTPCCLKLKYKKNVTTILYIVRHGQIFH